MPQNIIRRICRYCCTSFSIVFILFCLKNAVQVCFATFGFSSINTHTRLTILCLETPTPSPVLTPHPIISNLHHHPRINLNANNAPFSEMSKNCTHIYNENIGNCVVCCCWTTADITIILSPVALIISGLKSRDPCLCYTCDVKGISLEVSNLATAAMEALYQPYNTTGRYFRGQTNLVPVRKAKTI